MGFLYTFEKEWEIQAWCVQDVAVTMSNGGNKRFTVRFFANERQDDIHF